MDKWKTLTDEQLRMNTELYLEMVKGEVNTVERMKALARKCAVLAHRLTKYEGVPNKQDDNGN